MVGKVLRLGKHFKHKQIAAAVTRRYYPNNLVAYRLKQKQVNRPVYRSVSMVLARLKSQTRSCFFATVTVLTTLAILTLSLLANFTHSINTTRSSFAKIADLASHLLTADPKDIEANLDKIQRTILADLRPILTATGTESLLHNEFDQIRLLLRQWLTALQPLLNYQLTTKGLVHLSDIHRTFTDDLVVFLQKLETELLPRTVAHWQSLSPYLWAAKLAGNPTILEIENLIQNLLVVARLLVANQTPVLQALGHYQRQRLLIFNQNIGEARPTGGFIGSYISIDLEKGRIHINESNSIYHPDNSIKQKLFMHPATAYYGWSFNVDAAGDHGIRNSNFLPCFPETAAILHQGFLSSPHGYNIDLMVFITPQLVLDLLGSDFTFEVADLGSFSSTNLMDEIERLTGIEYTDSRNPKKDIQKILESLLREVPRIIKRRSPVEWLHLMLRALRSRDLQIWSSQKSVQTFFEISGLSSLALCHRSQIPEIGFLLANISGDKRNLITQNQFNLYSEKTAFGTKIHLKYKQLLPAKPNLARGFAGVESFTFVALQLPAEATQLSVRSPQAIHVPFIRPYYEALFKKQYNRNLTQLAQVAQIVRTGRNLFDERGNPPGFVYQHSNGSQVLGIYICDWDTVAEVEFSFILPSQPKVVQFYGQPGLQQPSLSLGKNVQFYDTKTTATVLADYYAIPAGVYLQL